MNLIYRFFAVTKPFLQLLYKRRFSVSRWSLLITLARLAVLKRRRSGNSEVSVRLGHLTILAPDYEVVSVLLKEKFVDQEYYFESSSDAPVIIDCGANIGISVLYFKSLFPNCTIQCFEPYPTAYRFLEKNIAINKLQHVTVHRYALSNVDGEIDLHIPAGANIINATINKEFKGGQVEKIRCVKLSDQLRLLGLVELVKLDVEGSEIDILDDLQESGLLDKKTINQLVIEFHQSFFRSKKRLDYIVNQLRELSYDVQTKAFFAEMQMSDVLIKAR